MFSHSFHFYPFFISGTTHVPFFPRFVRSCGGMRTWEAALECHLAKIRRCQWCQSIEAYFDCTLTISYSFGFIWHIWHWDKPALVTSCHSYLFALSFNSVPSLLPEGLGNAEYHSKKGVDPIYNNGGTSNFLPDILHSVVSSCQAGRLCSRPFQVSSATAKTCSRAA